MDDIANDEDDWTADVVLIGVAGEKAAANKNR